MCLIWRKLMNSNMKTANSMFDRPKQGVYNLTYYSVISSILSYSMIRISVGRGPQPLFQALWFFLVLISSIFFSFFFFWGECTSSDGSYYLSSFRRTTVYIRMLMHLKFLFEAIDNCVIEVQVD